MVDHLMIFGAPPQVILDATTTGRGRLDKVLKDAQAAGWKVGKIVVQLGATPKDDRFSYRLAIVVPGEDT